MPTYKIDEVKISDAQLDALIAQRESLALPWLDAREWILRGFRVVRNGPKQKKVTSRSNNVFVEASGEDSLTPDEAVYMALELLDKAAAGKMAESGGERLRCCDGISWDYNWFRVKYDIEKIMSRMSHRMLTQYNGGRDA